MFLSSLPVYFLVLDISEPTRDGADASVEPDPGLRLRHSSVDLGGRGGGAPTAMYMHKPNHNNALALALAISRMVAAQLQRRSCVALSAEATRQCSLAHQNHTTSHEHSKQLVNFKRNWHIKHT